MDNAHYHTVRIDPNGDKQDQSDKGERLAIAISRLIRNRDWKIVVEELLTKRLEAAREQADRLDGPECHRFQGDIRILKFLINLEKALTAQQQTIEHHAEEE